MVRLSAIFFYVVVTLIPGEAIGGGVEIAIDVSNYVGPQSDPRRVYLGESEVRVKIENAENETLRTSFTETLNVGDGDDNRVWFRFDDLYAGDYTVTIYRAGKVTRGPIVRVYDCEPRDGGVWNHQAQQASDDGFQLTEDCYTRIYLGIEG